MQGQTDGADTALLLRQYRNALERIEQLCDEYAGGTFSRRIRSIVRKVRIAKPLRAAPLDANEERRRLRVYGLELTDRESGRVLGITGQAYQKWRRTRGLRPWRRRGRRSVPPS